MVIRLFILAAVILTVFAVIASAAHEGLCLGVSWYTWVAAALLAYFVDLLIGGWAFSTAGLARRPPPPPQ